MQFPKDIVLWIEGHQGLAAWVQAFGAISAIAVAAYIARMDSRRQHERDEYSDQKELRRAKGLAILLCAEVISFKATIELAIARRDIDKADIAAPETLTRLAPELNIMGPAGGCLLQMMSALNANRIMVAHSKEALDGEHGDSVDHDDLWPRIEEQLRLTLECCDEAIGHLIKLSS